jgi:exodeoxyribonuclease V alpha subunit
VSQIQGQIQKINFQSDDSGFTIVSLKVPGQALAVTAVGRLPAPAVGEEVELVGEYRNHPRFGLQFQVSEYRAKPPSTEAGLKRYLGSGLVKGVGPVLAGRLVEAFGDQVLKILDEEPDRLADVPGLGPVRRESLITAWRTSNELRELSGLLSAYQLGPALAVKILKRYGPDAARIVREDPYRLGLEIHGVGFLTADKVARSQGIAPDAPARLEAALIHRLEEAVLRGNDLLPSGALVESAQKLIPEASKKDLEAALARLSLAGRVVAERGDEPGDYLVFTPRTHRAEHFTAKAMADLLAEDFSKPVPRPGKALEWAEGALGAPLTEDQRQAVLLAITSKAAIVTGGPGTGKTTMTRAVAAIWRAVTPRMALAAPTGRAAKRLALATGLPATTIHRLLEFSPAGGFVHGPDNPLQLDMLLVDEASMLDIFLAHQLLASLPSSCALILVGDVDQLPPVGPGRFLGDLLDSGLVPKIRLTKVFRQAEESLVITAAHMINSGQSPESLTGGPDGDFHFVAEEDPALVVDKIVRLVAERIPRKLGVDPVSDIMVLAPTRKGELGTANINAQLGKALNPAPGPSIARFGQTLKAGDRVMQIRNNYPKDVFNGDLGVVADIDLEAQEVAVDFEDKRAVYDLSELDELSLAWATTVHKAQGSEFEAVVVPVHASHHVMLRRKLLYTAVTRGRRMVFLVGSPEALRRAVGNAHEDARHSRLLERLLAAVRERRIRDNRGLPAAFRDPR